MRRIGTRLGLVALGLLFGAGLVVLVELSLRAFGVAPPKHDPFAGFASVAPLFERATRKDGTPIYRTSSRRRLPHREEFLARKPAGGFRVFVVGESSAAGVPYPATMSFAAFLRAELGAELPGVPVEVVNAAVPGYASRRILAVVREIAQYQPDLLIIYTGHNEFAERRYYEHLLEIDPRAFRLREWVAGTHLGALATQVIGEEEEPRIEFEDADSPYQFFAVAEDHLAGKVYPSARELEYGEMHYRFNLEEMIRAIREVGGEVMLVTLAQNLTDWAPGASTHRGELAPQDLARFDELVAEGDRLFVAGEPRGALAPYQDALAIDDTYAALHFKIASTHRTLGELDAARRHYRLASDLDRVPHGAPSRFNDILNDLARRNGTLEVDADAVLESAAPNGLVGDELFADMMHPKIRANQLIASAIAAELRRSGRPRPSSQWRSGYAPPSPEELYRADPTLEEDERLVRAAACWLARRYDCAVAELDVVLAADPNHPWAGKLRTTVEKRRATESMQRTD